MPRLARRSAGERVLGLVERLNDDLLAEEQASFWEIELPFATIVGPAERLTRQAVLSGKGVPGLAVDTRWGVSVDALHEKAVGESVPVLSALLEKSALLTLESMGEQLDWCEQTMPKRLHGSAAAGIRVATTTRDLRIEEARDAFLEAAARAREDWRIGVADQLQRMVLSQNDDAAELLLRLFSPTPNRLKDMKGRGVWWRAVSTLQRYAREVSIAMCNRLSTDAIIGLNAEVERRG